MFFPVIISSRNNCRLSGRYFMFCSDEEMSSMFGYCFLVSRFFLRRNWTLNSLAQHLIGIRDFHSIQIIEEFHLSSIQNRWSKFQQFLHYHGIANLWDQPYLWRDNYWFVFWNGCTFGWRWPSLAAASWAYWRDDFCLWVLPWFPFLSLDWITWLSQSSCDWVWTLNLERTLKLSEISSAH